MPDFEITDRQTGESLTITADREPSQDDVAEIFASRPKAKAPADLSGVKLDPYEQARMAGTMPVQAGATTGPAHPEEVLTIPESLMQPPVSIPRIEGKTVPGKIGAGLVNVAGGLFNMAASPVGLATLPMGGTEVGGAVLKGLFGGLMAKEAGRALGEASVTKDPQAITEAVAATALAPAIALPKIRPAIRTMDGKVVEGKAGETHNEIIKENELKPQDIDRREFVDQKGNELSREQAAAVTGLPTETEAGKLHSTDLPEAKTIPEGKPFASHGTIPYIPTQEVIRFAREKLGKDELQRRAKLYLDAGLAQKHDVRGVLISEESDALESVSRAEVLRSQIDAGNKEALESRHRITDYEKLLAAEPAKPPPSEAGKAEATTPPPTAVAGEEGTAPGTVTAAPGTASQSAAPAGAEAAIRETKPENRGLQGVAKEPWQMTKGEFESANKSKPYLKADIFARGQEAVASARKAALALIERAKAGTEWTVDEVHSLADSLGFTIAKEPAYLMGKHTAGESGSGKISLRPNRITKGRIKPDAIETVIHEMGHELLYQKGAFTPWKTERGKPLVRGEWAEVEKMSSRRDRAPWHKNTGYYTSQTERYARLFQLFLTRNSELKTRAPNLYSKVESLISESAPAIIRMREVYKPHYESGIPKIDLAHKWEVKLALAEGKPVPPEVLKEHPDLAKPGAGEAQAVPQGPGAATLGDVPKEPQIVQLTKALQDVDSPRRPLGERVRDMFNLSEHRSLAQTALGKALDGLKTTRDYLIKKWDGVKDWDDIKRVKGELSAEINERGWALRQFEKRARQAIPNRRDREAVASWLDNGGDEAKLRTALAKAPERYKQSYRDALNLSPDLKINAEQVRSYFEARLTEAIDAGVLRDGIEDYIHRIYKRDTPVKDRILNQVQSGVLNTRSPRLAMQRVFEFDHEAEAAGYPIVKDFLPRLVDYEYSLARVIADRKAVKQFMAIRMPDGRPMIDVAGVGIPVENAQGVTEAMLVKPGFKRGDPNEPGAPSYRRDYLQRNDYPAFRRWRWVDTDPVTKRDVFVEGDVLVHPKAADRIDALMAKSAIRRSRLGSAALGASSVFKQTMLDFSGFHQVQIALHAAEHRVLPWNILKDIDLANPKVQGLLKGGLNIGGDFHAFDYREGLVGHSLSRLIPGLGEVMQSYHEYLFRDFIPRVKTTMALHALERNRQRMPTLSEEQLNYLTAKQANAAFGELNYIVMERSKTVQDLARLVFLAPDFLEARGSFAAQTAQRLGKKGEWTNEQRTALFLGAVTMWVTARLANKLNDDQWHFEPENAFSLVHNGHTYSLRTVQGDLLHLWDKPFQFWLNRLNPVFGRSFLELGTGRDYYGRKRSRMELAWDLFANIRPIAFRSSQERKLWESVANSFGIQVKRWNDTDSAFKLAQQWKEKQGIGERGEFIYDAEKDPLRPLKLALTSNDDGLATTEIRKLLQSGYNRPRLVEYFRRYMRMPFTGSLANDAKWKRTLTEDQMQTVRTAQDHKQAVSKLFFNALRNYDAAKAGGR